MLARRGVKEFAFSYWSILPANTRAQVHQRKNVRELIDLVDDTLISDGRHRDLSDYKQLKRLNILSYEFWKSMFSRSRILRRQCCIAFRNSSLQ